jgi:hypothetical protein
MSMTMPGFTAELSIYNTSKFRPAGIGRVASTVSNHIVPQGGRPPITVGGNCVYVCRCWPDGCLCYWECQ